MPALGITLPPRQESPASVLSTQAHRPPRRRPRFHPAVTIVETELLPTWDHTLGHEENDGNSSVDAHRHEIEVGVARVVREASDTAAAGGVDCRGYHALDG